MGSCACVQAMQETMEENAAKNNFLIDGFPRNQNNLDGWNKAMGDKSNLRFVLFFDCSEEVNNMLYSTHSQ